MFEVSAQRGKMSCLRPSRPPGSGFCLRSQASSTALRPPYGLFQTIPGGLSRDGPFWVVCAGHSRGEPLSQRVSRSGCKQEQHSLCFEEAHSLKKKKKKVGTHLIHQDDSYLGLLRLHSGPVPACEGLWRLGERKLPSPPVWVQRRLSVAIEITLLGTWNQVAENPGVRHLEGP